MLFGKKHRKGPGLTITRQQLDEVREVAGDEIAREAEAIANVVDDVDHDKDGVYICSLAEEPSHFTDNEVGACAHCGKAIQFRPSAPPTLTKVCMPCAILAMREEEGRA